MSGVLLLSGGIDSAAIAFWKRPAYAVTVDYGQAPAKKEIDVATFLAAELGISHEIVRVDIRGLGTGLLADSTQLAIAPTPEWWPFRNQFLITIGAMVAVKVGENVLMIGTVKSDTRHRDNTPKFVRSIDKLINEQEGLLQVQAPAHNLTTKELIKLSGIPFSVLARTHSCHRGNLACGSCCGCLKQIEIVEFFATARC